MWASLLVEFTEIQLSFIYDNPIEDAMLLITQSEKLLGEQTLHLVSKLTNFWNIVRLAGYALSVVFQVH